MIKYFFWPLLFILFFLRYLAAVPKYQDGDRIRIRSHVTEEPSRGDNYQSITLKGVKIYLDPYPEISYGDRLVVEGIVDGRKLKDPTLLGLKKSEGSFYSLREKMLLNINSTLPYPHSALVSGVVLGSKKSIFEDFWQDLKVTGTAHVVVASGMNVSLVGGFVLNSLILLTKRKKAALASIAVIWLYVLFCGLEAPLVRAGIMGSVAFIAQGLGKIYFAKRALFLSAFTMLIINPLWFWDLGFILSFMATLSLILFETKINRLIYFLPKFFRQDFSTSLAAQIGVAPILFISFGNFNPVSPLINALILWTIAPITILGMISSLLGIISANLSLPILYLTYPLSSWFLLIINFFS